jgi:hypothetical protein
MCNKKAMSLRFSSYSFSIPSSWISRYSSLGSKVCLNPDWHRKFIFPYFSTPTNTSSYFCAVSSNFSIQNDINYSDSITSFPNHNLHSKLPNISSEVYNWNYSIFVLWTLDNKICISFRTNFKSLLNRQYQVEYRQVVKYTTNVIRCKGAIIDYMFRPFFIRPSSGLAWRSKEELVQLYKVQKVHYLG